MKPWDIEWVINHVCNRTVDALIQQRILEYKYKPLQILNEM